jgi:hypothetical protein
METNVKTHASACLGVPDDTQLCAASASTGYLLRHSSSKLSYEAEQRFPMKPRKSDQMVICRCSKPDS